MHVAVESCLYYDVSLVLRVLTYPFALSLCTQNVHQTLEKVLDSSSVALK